MVIKVSRVFKGLRVARVLLENKVNRVLSVNKVSPVYRETQAMMVLQVKMVFKV